MTTLNKTLIFIDTGGFVVGWNNYSVPTEQLQLYIDYYVGDRTDRVLIDESELTPLIAHASPYERHECIHYDRATGMLTYDHARRETARKEAEREEAYNTMHNALYPTNEHDGHDEREVDNLLLRKCEALEAALTAANAAIAELQAVAQTHQDNLSQLQAAANALIDDNANVDAATFPIDTETARPTLTTQGASIANEAEWQMTLTLWTDQHATLATTLAAIDESSEPDPSAPPPSEE